MKTSVINNGEINISSDGKIVGTLIPRGNGYIFRIGEFGGYYHTVRPYEEAVQALCDISATNYAAKMLRLAKDLKRAYRKQLKQSIMSNILFPEGFIKVNHADGFDQWVIKDANNNIVISVINHPRIGGHYEMYDLRTTGPIGMNADQITEHMALYPIVEPVQYQQDLQINDNKMDWGKIEQSYGNEEDCAVYDEEIEQSYGEHTADRIAETITGHLKEPCEIMDEAMKLLNKAIEIADGHMEGSRQFSHSFKEDLKALQQRYHAYTGK